MLLSVSWCSLMAMPRGPEIWLVRLSCIDENLPTARLRHRTDELRRRSTGGDLRALHRRDGPGGSHGKEGLGPIPEVGQCGR